VQDPDDFLKEQKLSFKDPVDPSRDAVIDALHRARIGNDWFFFATRETKDAFLREPFRYALALSDPVNHARFTPSKSSPKLQRAGIEFRFASKATKAAFEAAPDSFYHARGQMLP
jgi:YHS domain-containing protein